LCKDTIRQFRFGESIILAFDTGVERGGHLPTEEPVLARAGSPAYLFNWNPGVWALDELRKRVDEFDSTGFAKESWSCNAGTKVRAGDRAYLLKMGKLLGTIQRGIFGRGHIAGEAVKRGQRDYRVDIEFNRSQGDMLWDPAEHLLVHEEELSRMPRADRFKNMQKAGETLNPEAAHQIDVIIDDIIIDDSIPKGTSHTQADEAAREVVRRRRLTEQGMRPEQGAFSETIRNNYRCKCALTGCVTPAALQAAHVRTHRGVDDNSPTNGILLRADVHALLDRLLITLTEDGTKMEISPELTDEGYAFLRRAVVSQPDQGPLSAAENIREHRNRFFARQKQIVRSVP
jgi:hypothetical protein